MNLWRLLPALLLGLLAQPTLSAGLSEAQDAQLTAYLVKVGAKGSIPKKFVQTVVADKPNSDISFVVVYTHEDPEGLGAQTLRQDMAVFGPHQVAPIVVTKVGGKLHRSATLRRVHGYLIDLDVVLYGVNDAACCPSINAEVVYELNSQRLEEGTMRLLTTRLSGP